MENIENSVPFVKTKGTHGEKAINLIHERYANHMDSLDDQEKDFLKECEKEKTPEQLAILDCVNEEAMKLMVKYGREPYRIPYENYHLIPAKDYREVLRLNSSASADSERQGIVFRYGEHKNDLLIFGQSAFHETLHLLAPLKFETSESGFRRYRQGVSILTLQKDIARYGRHEHFIGLHEAIVSKSTDEFAKKLLEHPLLKKQKEWRQSKKFENLRKEESKKGWLKEEEIVWINEESKSFQSISYPIHQRLLKYLCEEIQEEFSEKHQSTEKVFEEFEKAHFTGKLFEIARLIEKTFGKGSFRSLGDMNEKDESASRKFEEFTKLRRQQHD